MGLFTFFKKKENTSSCCSENETVSKSSCCSEQKSESGFSTSSACSCSSQESSASSCSSSSQCDCGGCCGDVGIMPKSRFIFLGACCKKSTESFENVKTAVKALGLEDEVIQIGDAVEIAQYGVMQTPALVINNKVVSMGKSISVETAKKLISIC